MKDVAPIILSIATLIATIGSIWMSYRNSKKIEVVHVATNSMKDQLVREVREASLLQGAADERAKHGDKT